MVEVGGGGDQVADGGLGAGEDEGVAVEAGRGAGEEHAAADVDGEEEGHSEGGGEGGGGE